MQNREHDFPALLSCAYAQVRRLICLHAAERVGEHRSEHLAEQQSCPTCARKWTLDRDFGLAALNEGAVFHHHMLHQLFQIYWIERDLLDAQAIVEEALQYPLHPYGGTFHPLDQARERGSKISGMLLQDRAGKFTHGGGRRLKLLRDELREHLLFASDLVGHRIRLLPFRDMSERSVNGRLSVLAWGRKAAGELNREQQATLQTQREFEGLLRTRLDARVKVGGKPSGIKRLEKPVQVPADQLGSIDAQPARRCQIRLHDPPGRSQCDVPNRKVVIKVGVTLECGFEFTGGFAQRAILHLDFHALDLQFLQQ